MAKKEAEKPPQIMITDEVKHRWALIPEEGHPLLMADYARLTLDELKRIDSEIKTIRTAVGFLATVAALAILSGIYVFLSTIFNF